MKNPSFKNLKIWWILSILILSIVSCAPGTVQPTDMLVETADKTQTFTVPAMTQTATMPPEAVVLAIGANANPSAVIQIQTALKNLVSDSGLTLLEENALNAQPLTPNIRVVVGVGPGLDLNSLAAGTPATEFIAVDDPSANAAENVGVIGNPESDQQRQAFVAGYVAAVVSEDYKIAALIPSDVNGSELLTDAFTNGARFFCGMCNPKYPPYHPFPQWETLLSTSGIEDLQLVVNNFMAMGVEVLYVDGRLLSPELLNYLADTNVKLISDSHPAEVIDSWVGTVSLDRGLALSQLWTDMISGGDGKQFPVPVALIDTDAGLISEGRYRLIQEFLDDLQAGLITPITDD